MRMTSGQYNAFIAKKPKNNRRGGEITESDEQIAIFEWAVLHERRYPELKWMFHIPNGGVRDKATAKRLKREGVKPGVPDICLPVARRGYHGLYIELKCKNGGRVGDNQKEWIRALNNEGYKVAVCHGYEETISVIEGYLE